MTAATDREDREALAAALRLGTPWSEEFSLGLADRALAAGFRRAQAPAGGDDKDPTDAKAPGTTPDPDPVVPAHPLLAPDLSRREKAWRDCVQHRGTAAPPEMMRALRAYFDEGFDYGSESGNPMERSEPNPDEGRGVGERPFEDLRSSGLLWLVNRVALHPRGFALALVIDNGRALGWQLVGDGSEPWFFADEDESFAAVEALLAAHRRHDVEDLP